MSGMHVQGGHLIADEKEHIRQSIRDILITPVGSRLMRRTYGSLLPDLIDYPSNPAYRLRLIAASIMAIIRWEPRVSVQSAAVTVALSGEVSIDMLAVRRSGPRTPQTINLSIPIR